MLGGLFKINVGIKPYQVGKGNPPQTRSTVDTRPFDSDRPLTKLHRACLRGSDIRRFIIAPLEPRYLKYGPWLAEPRPAADFDAPRKIVMRQTGDSLVAALDQKQYLCMNNMHVLVPKGDDVRLEYVLGVVNSKLLNWYYHTLNPEVGEALAEVKKTNVAALPIALPSKDHPKQIALSSRIADAAQTMIKLNDELETARNPDTKMRLDRQLQATERQIDRAVYELYGLTDEEIALVEQESGQR